LDKIPRNLKFGTVIGFSIKANLKIKNPKFSSRGRVTVVAPYAVRFIMGKNSLALPDDLANANLQTYMGFHIHTNKGKIPKTRNFHPRAKLGAP
jgi:hypothetical protein